MQEAVPGTSKFNFAQYTGRGVNVAIIDSGVDGTHPYLKNAVKGGVAIGVDADGNIHFQSDHGDVSGHGTGCAGLIRRIAPEAQLYSIKILDENLEAYTEVLAEGIVWAAENNMHIINLSLGTSNKQLGPMLQEACDFAYSKNVVIVAAGDRAMPDQYPAVFRNVLGVGGAEIVGKYAYSAEPGDEIEFLTGDGVNVPWLNHQYSFNYGASFAAAHLTGIVTLILEAYPSVGFDQVREVLIANALRE